MDRRYILSEIVARTGAKRRAVQLWADGGVIESTKDTDRAGTGVHRSFDAEEVQIAALLAPLAQAGTPIGMLKKVSELVRPSLLVVQRVTDPQWAKIAKSLEMSVSNLAVALKRAIAGQGENYLLFAHADDYLWISSCTDEGGPVCINPRRNFPKSQDAKHVVVFVLDLTRILFGLFD